MPEEEGSELLADVIYQKEPKWNVYQEETYRLSKKLRGITSLCFVLRQKVHIKGFLLKKPAGHMSSFLQLIVTPFTVTHLQKKERALRESATMFPWYLKRWILQVRVRTGL